MSTFFSAALALGCLSAAALAAVPSALPGHPSYTTANSTYQVEYFSWWFEPQSGVKTAPLVLWLTGGPGCSSELALAFENGPFTVNSDLSIKPNPYSWNKDSYLLYVDQPGGTGFSTVGNPKGYVVNEDQVAIDMINFLTNLFKKEPILGQQDLFIIGESYAGHYVPAICAAIAQGNAKFNLKGCAVGNGFIDPVVQTVSFGPFLHTNGKITQSQLQQVQSGVPQCQQDVANGDWTSAFNDCGAVLNNALAACSQTQGSQCNVYNYKAPCNGPLCYDFTNIISFFNDASVQSMLGVNVQWQTCDSTAYFHLESDFDKGYQQDLPIIMAAGIPVTIYNGELDIICNAFGEYAVVNSLKWPGSAGFISAKNETWTVNGQAAGNYRHHQTLTYVQVANAGHMVPHDQPANALDLLNRILKNQW